MKSDNCHGTPSAHRHNSLCKPSRFTFVITQGWGACVLYALSDYRQHAVLRSIEQGWEGLHRKQDHRSIGPTYKSHATPSGDRPYERITRYLVKDHRSIGPTDEPRVNL